MKEMISISATAMILLSLAGACTEPTPVPEPGKLEFAATLDASSQAPFKTAWVAGDVLEIACVDEGKLVVETLKADRITSDAKTAVFTSNGKLPSDAAAYYALVPGTGARFNGTDSWSINADAAAVPSFTVASCGADKKEFHLSNLYSLVAFASDNEKVSYAVLSGNDGEYLVPGTGIDFSSSKPVGDKSCTSLRRDVKPGETVYFGLLGGTVLTKGYKVEAFDAQGVSLFTCTGTLPVRFESGRLVQAPAKDETPVDPGEDTPVDPGEDTPKDLRFTAKLPQSEAPFKSVWTAGDELELACVVDGAVVTERIGASDISSDGKTAAFVSGGKLPKSDEYYAVICGTGVEGYGNKTWSTADISDGSVAVPSVTVAKTAGDFVELEFRNIFSVLTFVVNEPAVAKVVLTGNADEVICKNMQVSFSSFNANGSSSPSFEGRKSMSRKVTSGEKACFGLYPGLKLSSGYTLTAYDASGKKLGTAKTVSSIKVEKGVVYAAPDFAITNPSVKTKGFDESNIVFSAAVVSDVHINGATSYNNKWQSALRQLKAKASEQDKDGLDAVLVAGDLIDQPNTSQLSSFKSVYEAEADPEKLPLIYTVGNHDVPNYRWAASAPSDAAYMRSGLGEKYFRTDLDQDMRQSCEARHCVVNGYHILCVTPNGTQPILYDSKVLQWLDNQLASITAEDPEHYVILLTHPMLTDTIYGSMLGESDGVWASSLPHYWASAALTPILNKYPQVMVFGGHLHFPLNDPRSVWQGGFTVFGCGSVRYMAIESGGYQNMKSATVMNDCEQFSQGNLLQFDASGNFRLMRMDFHNGAVIGDALKADYPTADKAHLSAYNHARLALANTAPELTSLTTSTAASGNVTAVWASGKDDEFVHHYELTLRCAGKTVNQWKYLADFYLYPKPSQMKSEWSQSLGVLDGGSYELELRAYDSWNQEAVLTTKFVIGSDSRDVWTGDSAGSAKLNGGQGKLSSDWLSYEDGTISWESNTTGRPRSLSITLPDGTEYKHTQIAASDFKGDWELLSKRFNPNGSAPGAKGTTNAHVQEVKFGAAIDGETLTDASGNAHVSEIGIKGLYLDAVIDACVDIDYNAHLVRVGLLLDRRKAKDAGSLKYVAFLPECASKTFAWSGYNFYPGSKAFSSTDYDWMWFSCSSDWNTLSFRFTAADGQLTSNGAYGICGISCVAASSTSASSISTSAYDVIYQANYNSETAKGMSFVRK